VTISSHSEDWIVDSLTEPGYPCNAIQQVEGALLPPTSLECPVTLTLPTFTATAELAGISRIYGGFHIQADNVEGLVLGWKIAQYNWPIIQSYFDGRRPGPQDITSSAEDHWVDESFGV
jgi:hypothetical protein